MPVIGKAATPVYLQPRFTRPELLRHPNIPKPLHGIAPRAIYGKEWWDEQRYKAYAVNNYCCWACGIHKTRTKYYGWLEAHETFKYNWKIGELVFTEIVALCHLCHAGIHSGRSWMMLEAGKITEQMYKDIMTNKKMVLARCTTPPIEEKHYDVPWDQWVMVIDGKRYHSKFKDFREWAHHYNVDISVRDETGSDDYGDVMDDRFYGGYRQGNPMDYGDL